MAQDPIASLVECAICANRYHETDSLRSPRRLPCCGKICCQACVLLTREKQQGICPYCRQEIQAKIEGLPLCRVTLDLLASLCNNCSSSQSLLLCSHCHKNYCADCHDDHRRSLLDEAVEACQIWITDRRVEVMSARVEISQALEELCERAESELDLMENNLLLVKMKTSSVSEQTEVADSVDLGCEAMKAQSRYHLQRIKEVQEVMQRGVQKASETRAGEALGGARRRRQSANNSGTSTPRGFSSSNHFQFGAFQPLLHMRLQLNEVTGMRKVGHRSMEHRIFSMVAMDSGSLLLAEKSRLWSYDVDTENPSMLTILADQRVIPGYHKYQGWCTAITCTADHILLAISHYRRSSNVIMCLSLRELALLGISTGEDSSADSHGGFFFVQALAVDVSRGRLFAVETSSHKLHALSYPGLVYQCLAGDSSTLRSPAAACVTTRYLLVAGVHGLAVFDAEHPQQHLCTVPLGGVLTAVQLLRCLDTDSEDSDTEEQQAQQEQVLCVGKNRACVVRINEGNVVLIREDMIPVSGELLVTQTDRQVLVANRNSYDVQVFEYI